MSLQPSMRRGTAVIIAMCITSLSVVLLLNSGAAMVGMNQTQQVSIARDQAIVAAESVASLLESSLSSESANLTSLKTDIASNPTIWLGLKGFCPGPLAQNTNSGIYFGNCMVVWRVEPVSVYSASYDPSAGLANKQVFLVNSEPNASLATTRISNATTADSTRFPALADSLLNQDPLTYYYRIVCQAYYLSSPSYQTTGLPWDNSTQFIAQAQAQRICQLQVTSLFQYALFYAATGPVGDIEFATGTGLTVTGAVHSNNAIYFMGGDSGGLGPPVNYHLLASGSSAAPAEAVTIGSAASKTAVTAVGGIFRLGKYPDILADTNVTAGGFFPGASNPYTVPLDGVGLMTGNNDLNGDAPNTFRHSINGIGFTSSCDSRTDYGINGMLNTFSGYVRDSTLGATVVTTLSNIPSLAGRPFEQQSFGGSTSTLYTTDLGNAADHASWTANNTAATVPLYYTQNPTTYAGVASFQYAANAYPGTCSNLPMFWTDNTYTSQDIHPLLNMGETWTASQPTTDVVNNPHGIGDADAGFSPWEVKGPYLALGLYGAGKTFPFGSLNSATGYYTTGLVIRERTWQNAGLNWNQGLVTLSGAPFTAPFANPVAGCIYANATLPAATITSYIKYLESQYAVYLDGVNITTVFFGQLATTTSPANFIATEDNFIDGREDMHMQYMYGINPGTYPAAGGSSYRMNAITLNMAAVQTWLKNTVWSTCTGNAANTETANNHFNGVVYIHRTRRSLTYEPIERPAMVWSLPAAAGGLSGLYTYPTAATTFTNPLIGITAATLMAYPYGCREGDGPLETMAEVVRIRNAGTINYAGAGTALSANGLTFVTPERLYLWGDVNNATYTDSNEPTGDPNLTAPPVACFADCVDALSDAWLDQNNYNYSNAGGVTYSATIATATSYITSLVMNNVTTYSWNSLAGGNGGPANMVRFIEDWNGNTYTLKGSAVVMNFQRYSLGALDYVGVTINNGIAVYSPPSRNITFNTDLMLADGQPPFSPFGVQVAQVVGVQNVLDD